MTGSAKTKERRYTRDGSAELESHLAEVCATIGRELSSIIPSEALEGVALGGGYGRGEGGVLRTEDGDKPYNDLECFVFVRGPVPLSDRRYGPAVHGLGHRLTEEIGIEVEFKILSLQRLRSSEVTMFFYDLVCGHRVIVGPDNLLEPFDSQRDASAIPLHESQRLLMNRCSGLLFALERLGLDDFDREDADFVGRNLAKARLALGDVVLAVRGEYHWSCIERHARLREVKGPFLPLEKIHAFHEAGVEFKLHPVRASEDRETLAETHAEISKVAWAVWQWLAEKRFGTKYESPSKFSTATRSKCPETRRLKNLLVRMRAFGLSAGLRAGRFRYPREALINTLPILLWEQASFPESRAFIGKQLSEDPGTWSEALAAYTKLWEQFN